MPLGHYNNNNNNNNNNGMIGAQTLPERVI